MYLNFGYDELFFIGALKYIERDMDICFIFLSKDSTER